MEGIKKLENYIVVLKSVKAREDFNNLKADEKDYVTQMIKKNLLASLPLRGNMLNLTSKHIPKAKVIAHAVVEQYFEANL